MLSQMVEQKKAHRNPMRLFCVIRRVSCLFKVSLNDVYDELNAAVLRTSGSGAVAGTRVGCAESL